MGFSSRFSPGGRGQLTGSGVRDKPVLYELNGTVKGRKAWYILKVIPEKHAELKRKLAAASSMELTEYGEILHSGWGDAPDEALRQRIKDEYGI